MSDGVTEVYFYHLERRTLEDVLPTLLERSLERGWRAAVQAASEERVEALDTLLWIYREESFGPVAAIIRVGSVDEAIAVANDCEYGLSGAVFCRDVGRALDVARRVESGICHINSATVADEPQIPFGGVKASGYGKFGGPAALDEFTELRWITISSGKGEYPI